MKPEALMKMVRLLCLAGLVCSETAFADDLPLTTPAYNAPVQTPAWAGFYLGAGLGFRSADTNVNVNSARNTSSPAVLTDQFVSPGCYAGLPCVTGGQFDGSTFRVSPYLGYNWQADSRWVLGIEADTGFGSQSTIASGYYPATPFMGGGSLSNSFSVKTTWDASLRGRVGFLVDPGVMVYGTGGPAWLHVESTSNCSTLISADGDCASGPGFTGLSPASMTHSSNKLGATVGAGVEAMLSSNWILRGEYRYSDYGAISNTDVRTRPSGVQTVDYDVRTKTHTASLGLAYKFGEPQRTPVSPLAAYGAMPSTTSWTGAYLGAGVGIRASESTASVNSATLTPLGSVPVNVIDQCQCFLDSAMNGTSFRFNPYAGYNWQLASRWMVGLEGDFGWANQKSTLDGGSTPGSGIFGSSLGMNDSYSISTKWDASLRLRLGYLVSPAVMIYGTAGPAWMNVEEASRCDTALQLFRVAPGFDGNEVGACAAGLRSPATISQSTTRMGVTVGGGGEMKLSNNWLVRAEYRYSDFGTARFGQTRSCAGTASVSGPGGTASFGCFETDSLQTAVRLRTSTAMFGLAYQFN